MHPFHFLIVILFAYGLQALAKGYLDRGAKEADSVPGKIINWWQGTHAFEHRWIKGCLAALGVLIAAIIVSILLGILSINDLAV